MCVYYNIVWSVNIWSSFIIDKHQSYVVMDSHKYE